MKRLLIVLISALSFTVSAQTWEYAELAIIQSLPVVAVTLSLPTEVIIVADSVPTLAQRLEDELGLPPRADGAPIEFRILTMLGQQDWELVGFSRQETGGSSVSMVFILKRPTE